MSNLTVFESNKTAACFLIGGAGVGKTELALNLSTLFKKSHDKVLLVDMDIVNPFFRVRKLAQHLKDKQIDLVGPEGKVASGDLPALPARVWGAIEDESSALVCDIGGGEAGLRPLGRVRELAAKRQARVFFVINPYRPEFATLQEMHKSFEHMCKLSAMQATDIIANPNLSGETSVEQFKYGYDLIKKFADEKKVNLAFGVVEKELATKLDIKVNSAPEFCKKDDSMFLVIERYWGTPWRFGL